MPETPPRDNGFTLLELLLAMAITTIIIALIFGTFRMGIRAWERGERDIDHQQRLRIVLELLNQQIAAHTLAVDWVKEASPAVVDGTRNRLSFVSRMALHPGHQRGVLYVQYAVSDHEVGVSLQVMEIPAALTAAPLDVQTDDPALAAKRRTLLSGMHDIAFNYLPAPDVEGDAEWLDTWDALDRADPPLAVRIQVQDRPDQAPVTLIVPLRSREKR